MLSFVKFLLVLTVTLICSKINSLDSSNYRKLVFPDGRLFYNLNFNESHKNQILPRSENLQSFVNEDVNEQPRLENRKYFQGDIILSSEQKEFLSTSKTNDSISTRTGVNLDDYHWAKAELGEVVIPYFVGKKSGFCKIAGFLC